MNKLQLTRQLFKKVKNPLTYLKDYAKLHKTKHITFHFKNNLKISLKIKFQTEPNNTLLNRKRYKNI